MWAFAAGLSVAPALSFYGDRGVEATVKWMARWAPPALRPYLPKPLEETRPPVHHAKAAARSVVVEPSAPSEEPVKHPQAHQAHGKHGGAAVTPAPAIRAEQPEKQTGDPFDQ
jgi:hypothetical protein